MSKGQREREPYEGQREREGEREGERERSRAHLESVKDLTLGFGSDHDLTVRSSPTSGSVLTVSGACLGFSVSSLSALSPLAISHHHFLRFQFLYICNKMFWFF